MRDDTFIVEAGCDYTTLIKYFNIQAEAHLRPEWSLVRFCLQVTEET